MPVAINYGTGFPQCLVERGDVRSPAVKAQARQAMDAASSQYGNGSQSPDGSGERYGATRI